MSMTWNPPKKSIVVSIDDSPKFMDIGWEPRRETRRASRSAGVGLVLVMGLLAWFWMEVVK